MVDAPCENKQTQVFLTSLRQPHTAHPAIASGSASLQSSGVSMLRQSASLRRVQSMYK